MRLNEYWFNSPHNGNQSNMHYTLYLHSLEEKMGEVVADRLW